jgi:hypothetical protein
LRALRLEPALGVRRETDAPAPRLIADFYVLVQCSRDRVS